MDRQSKAKGLYNLYREEKKQEEKTKKMLDELSQNAQQMQVSRMRLIEKLLDISVKDEISRKFHNDAAADEAHGAALNVGRVKENARNRLQDELSANIDRARATFAGSGFISKLDEMAHMDDAVARQELAKAVGAYINPHIEAVERQRIADRSAVELTDKDRSTSAFKACGLESIARTIQQVSDEKKRELAEQSSYRGRKVESDRATRVEQACAMLKKKDIGNLMPLFYTQPVDYKTDIGRREAQVNDLQKKIAAQRAEEERLLQYRTVQLSLIDSDQAKLTAEVETVCQQLVMLQRELETKEMDLSEMAQSQAPGTGSWAHNTVQLERDLTIAVEEEFHFRHNFEEIRKTLDILNAEKATLDGDLAANISELTTSQNEYQTVLAKLEERLNNEKKKLYHMREAETQTTRAINDLRFRMLHRREDVRRQKRELRSVINTTIAQLSIEDRMQSKLMSRSLELQNLAEEAKLSLDQKIGSLNNQLKTLNEELKLKSTQISAKSEELTNYVAGKKDQKEVNSTGAQLTTQIDQLVNDWARTEWEAASNIARVAALVDLNSRENERVLKEMAKLAVYQEDIASEGVDMCETPMEELNSARDNLYSDLTDRCYREAKYTQVMRMLRERAQLKSRGERMEPLTKNRRVSLEERRARREAVERSKAARQIALEHLRAHRSGGSASASPSSARIGDGSTMGSGLGSGGPQHSPEFRMLVINFIKKEIQPLYDANQITKRRYIDIVNRVSSWFLETHSPTSGYGGSLELSEQHVDEIVRKIKEVIQWQDKERLSQRH